MHSWLADGATADTSVQGDAAGEVNDEIRGAGALQAGRGGAVALRACTRALE